ncbi:N-6 DNA methylase [Mesorhizobium sp. M0816]|uniref:HsdM family class I SAM-dependent methyltransferase n=1 Tax=Mesorhizobium sp. M0816 TaxID=2957006 RepID=UPI003336EDAE
MSGPLDALASLLGYGGDPGYVRADAFAQQPNHRHALRLAAQFMQVRAAFGLWTGREGALVGPDRARFTPLVYLAEVADAAQAQQVHRSVWSQGLAPYLLAASADRVWICQGFAFSSTDWARHALEIPIVAPNDMGGLLQHPGLRPLFAKVLRSSLAWRDEARTADEFVDERLLRSLANLSVAFSSSTQSRRALDPPVINALIARLLYFYFLVDRRFITKERLAAWELTGIGLDEDLDWSLADTRTLFQRLDEVFNGSIFPMPSAYADAYDATHLNLLRRVLRHGAELGAQDSLQLSFLDYDFATIRTETLSAIYEMFLRNEDKEAGKRYGAFYTPPYLADYTLDRLEDQTALSAATRVLDPATGSGVFLVGAYRRIVEASLPSGETRLPLAHLHQLMTDNIFGVELNATACHVAAFSLYLTMLDYVDPNEAADYTRWPVLVGRPRLFPPMLKGDADRGANIRAGDFFSDVSDGIRCDIVVGNPPWVQLKNLRSPGAVAYLKQSRAPIGDKQAAELFLWKAYRDHLCEKGALGFLIPQKSLVNSYSDKFTQALRKNAELIGIADLAHLRYVLFRRSAARTAGAVESSSERGARQATAVILLRKVVPQSGHRFWLYRPVRSTQPASRSGRLWTLLHDWTQVLWQDGVGLSDPDWRRLFTCSPVDRRVLTKLDRQIASGRLRSLKQLDQAIGLKFRNEVDQNLDKRFVLSSDSRQPTFWRRQLGLDGSLVPDTSVFPLPTSELEKAHPRSLPFLMGNVVLMPRTCEVALFVESPIAGSDSFIFGCFPEFAGVPLPERHRIFLNALTRYMSTRTFRYLCFVNSRRMTIDRANTELSAVRELPWPFGDVDANDWPALLDIDNPGREALVCQRLGLPPVYRDLVEEFTAFREAFADGGTPIDAMRPSDANQIDAYLAAMLLELNAGRQRYAVSAVPVAGDLVAAVVEYRGKATSAADHSDQLARAAAEAYSNQGASTLTQSRYLWHSRQMMASVLLKPRERMHWTLDQAFFDADLVTAAAMSGYNSKEAV